MDRTGQEGAESWKKIRIFIPNVSSKCINKASTSWVFASVLSQCYRGIVSNVEKEVETNTTFSLGYMTPRDGSWGFRVVYMFSIYLLYESSPEHS